MNVFEISGLTKEYRGKLALGGIDMVLEQGLVLGLVGPNGAGKTTLLKCLLGLIRPDAGSVFVFGADPMRSGRDSRRRMGFVHETSYLPDRLDAATLGRLLSLSYPRWSPSAWDGYLRRFQVPRDRRIGTLSKGMKMRLALAAALSHAAELVLLDEPSSGLDPLARREMLDIIGEELCRGGRSFLVSTHITSDLDRIADRVMVIERGVARLEFDRDDLADHWALCKGPRELVRSAPEGLLLGVRNGAYGFTALTRDRNVLRRVFGDSVVVEPATIEDVLVHTLKGGAA